MKFGRKISLFPLYNVKYNIYIFESRAWYRYLYPIGALRRIFESGCTGKTRLINDERMNCGQCNLNCSMQADVQGNVEKHGEIYILDCIQCLKCTNLFPNNVITFTLSYKKASLHFGSMFHYFLPSVV